MLQHHNISSTNNYKYTNNSSRTCASCSSTELAAGGRRDAMDAWPLPPVSRSRCGCTARAASRAACTGSGGSHLQLRPCFIPRSHKPRSFESDF